MQTFHQWQQSPSQGAIPPQSPFTPADESYLIETLVQCRCQLETVLKTAQGYEQLPDLAEAIADSLTAIHKAEAITLDPATYVE
jgi:hypothetical protein